MSDVESLPACFCEPASIPPNVCDTCPCRDLCEACRKKIAKNFVPKSAVEELIAKIEAAIKEG